MRLFSLPLFMLMVALLGRLHAVTDEERRARRIQAHLTLRDFKVACEEARQSLTLYPQSIPLLEAYIRSLAKLGDEKNMLKEWERYSRCFPDKAMNRELIEEMSWGVLNKASHSSSLIMREMALLAAYFSQDTKGVAILYQGMRDSNDAIRKVAVKLSAHFYDHKLIEEIKRLFKQEKVWSVRERVLEAIGKMKIMSLSSDLEALIASNESLAKEKALAIAALIELLDHINRSEIERLVASNRAGLRQLVCRAIAHFQSLRDFDQLLILAEDPHPNVRLEALQAIGQLRPSEQISTILAMARKGLQDTNPQVAISAAWLLTLYAPIEGQQAFNRFLMDGRREVRYLAASALSATGRYGMPLILDQFHSHPDHYIRLNLTFGLIGQRIAEQEAAACLSHMLVKEKDKWYTLEIGLFRAIVNKPAKSVEDPLTTPEMDNQLLRLELLNLLAILKAPAAQQAIRYYLLERSWGISATAAAVLLTEGDETAIQLVLQLLQDPQPHVRLQAAFVLSLWSHEESAIQVLEEGYATNDRELKARILEGLGRIGSIRSIPFLINTLKEPSQTLRLIAAMSLIQCLNH